MLKQAPSWAVSLPEDTGTPLFIVCGCRVIEESRPPLARTTVEAVQGVLVAIDVVAYLGTPQGLSLEIVQACWVLDQDPIPCRIIRYP
jgi:hypothetical protein